MGFVALGEEGGLSDVSGGEGMSPKLRCGYVAT